MLKKVVSVIVGVACLVSMTGVFAASYTGTSTAYVGDKIEVTSYVTGNAGDTVTYLVHNKDKATADIISDDIVYIDQYEFVTAGETTFKYQTAVADIEATLLVGGDATAAEGAENAIPDAAFKVVDESGKVYWGKAALPEGAVKAFPLSGLAAGSIVTGVKIGDAAAAIWYVSDSADKTLYIADAIEGATATITITVEAAAATAADTLSMTYFSAAEVDADDEATGESVVVIGEVKGEAAEFGVVLAKSEAELATAENLKALAKNADGQFAVRVYDAEGFGVDELYAIAYYIDAEGTRHFAAGARKITINK